jgi:hypothetical protein
MVKNLLARDTEQNIAGFIQKRNPQMTGPIKSNE